MPVFEKTTKYRSDVFLRPGGNILVLALFAGLFLWPVGVPALNAALDAGGGPEVVDRIVAIVNEEIILLSEIEERLRPYEKQIMARNLPVMTERDMLYKAREEVIEERIDELLTAQKAVDLGIVVSDEEVDGALEQIKKTMLLTDDQLRRSLDDMGLTMEDYREQIRSQIRRTRVLSREVKSKIVVTDADIKDYYDQHSDRFAPATRYHLRNIIVQPSNPANRQEKEALSEKMNKIHRQIMEGASFASMAQEHSQSSFADKGGDLGFFELEELSPQIREAIQPMEPGEITPVLDTGIGLQIFYLEDIVSDSGQTVEAVSEEIRETIYQEKLDEKFNEWVKALREDSHIKIIR